MQKPVDRLKSKDTMSKFTGISTLSETGNSKSLTFSEVAVEQTNEKPYNSTSVKLQLCIDAHATYTGLETGKVYDWARAGSVVPVDSRDAPVLLEKRIKAQSCCNSSDNPVFQIVD